MHIAITLVCNPAAPLLTREAAALAAGVLADPQIRWLSEGVACDMLIADRGESRQEIEARLRRALADAPIDVVVQAAEGRRKRLLVADMDSTIIGQECIDELAEFAGLRAEISKATEQAMRGEIDFEEALLSRVGLLKGLPERVLEECFQSRITLNPGAGTLVRTMNKFGATTVLVSGGFTYFVERVARLAGFQRFQANELLIENGALTGKVKMPILGREAKENALTRIAGKLRISIEETLAVGDGANDLDMIGAAGLGVAYHAKPKVADAADARIDHGDLTALLYLQGVPRTEFVG